LIGENSGTNLRYYSTCDDKMKQYRSTNKSISKKLVQSCWRRSKNI